MASKRRSYSSALDHCPLRAVLIALAFDVRALPRWQCRAAGAAWLSELSSKQSAGTYGGVGGDGAFVGMMSPPALRPRSLQCSAVIAKPAMSRAARRFFCDEFWHGHATTGGGRIGRQSYYPGPVRGWTSSSVLRRADARSGPAWMLTRSCRRRALVLWAVPALLGAWVLWPAARGRPRRLARASHGRCAWALWWCPPHRRRVRPAPIPSHPSSASQSPSRTAVSHINHWTICQREVASAKSAAIRCCSIFTPDWWSPARR